MSDTLSPAASPTGPSGPAHSERQRVIQSAAAVLETDERDVRDDEDRCPSCDTEADWRVSRRHRFSPFGSVLLAVLSFWSAVFGWLLGVGFTPALVLFGGAVFISLATRKAEICAACGYVRRQRR